MRLFRLGRKPSSKFYCWQQLTVPWRYHSLSFAQAPWHPWSIQLSTSAARALASSSLMPSALPFLEPCIFISMHDRSIQQSTSAACTRVSPRARVLSYDFTMATHSEYAQYITKWRIRHIQLSMRRIHPLLRKCQDNAKLACHCTACQAENSSQTTLIHFADHSSYTYVVHSLHNSS